MANVKDYLAWRGDFGLEISPWNEIDGALMSVLSYLDFSEVDDVRGWTLGEALRKNLLREWKASGFAARKAVFEDMARSPRFRNCRMHHFLAVTDEEMKTQFSALCIDLPDNTLCVAYRGTDSTVVGWREDLNMCVLEPVPAQEAARVYLERAAALDERKLRLVGHSKGGNLAAWAAACATADVQDRILEVDSYDGPGMAPDIFNSDGYRRAEPKIHSYVPQTSVIGMLMEYHRRYQVVRSVNTGIMQHDLLSWQVYGPRFETLEEIDEVALTTRETLREWLEKTEPDQRAAFVDTTFDMIESTRATTVGELMGDKVRNLRTMISANREMDPESRKAFNRLVGLAVSLGFDKVLDRYRNRKAEDAPNPVDEES